MEIDEEKENKTLLKMYRALLRKAKPLLEEGDARLIGKAFRFAVEAHKDMRRKSGEPFIYHPVSVAHIAVSEIGLGTTSIIAALLHDVVEDTHYDLKDIENKFGPKVAQIIDGLTKIAATTSKGTSIQAENFKKMLLTISKDVRVVLIKIADRLHNMRTLNSMPKEKRLKIKAETEYIYAPLAHRLGLYNIKSELEDLSLKYSDPKAYADIVKRLDQTKEARYRFTRHFAKPIEKSLKKQKLNFKIKMRTKSIRSIYKKMKKQNVSFEEVYDLFAIRIIFDSSQDEEKAHCWRIYSVVTDHYTPNVNRLRDWISVPKSNGYESLHTTVMSHKGQWVEVQIRSERMDDIAEKGYAAHWKYKEQGKIPPNAEQGIEMWIRQVRESIEKNDLSAIEFMDDFRTNLFSKEVFTFSPKGDLKVFPSGATVLDFGFEIHSEVGARCLGAKVNGKLVPLNYKLQNGDQVEILTANKPKANDGWLSYITTSKARAKIKEYLKEDHKRLVSMGKEVVERKLKQMKLSISEGIASEIAEYFHVKTETELYYQIGAGVIDHKAIKKFRDEKLKKEEAKKPKLETAKDFKKEFQKIRKKGDDELVIGENMSDLEYSIAQCCSPIPGDEIFGFISISRGIIIHKTTCSNAVSLMANYGYRIIKARWAKEKDRIFEVDIEINGTDRVGIVKDVTRVISEQMQVNIKAIAIKTDESNSIFTGSIGLRVKDKHEVENLIRELEVIEGIEKVVRYDTALES